MFYNINMDPTSRDTLRNKLKSKIGAKTIGRSSKQNREHVLSEELARVGIDRKIFDDSLKLVNKLTPKQREALLQSKMPNLPTQL